MLNGLLSGLKKFFTRDRVIVLVVLIVLTFALVSYSGYKTDSIIDSMTGGVDSATKTEEKTQPSEIAQPILGGNSRAVASPSDLLPQDQNSAWASLNPSALGQGSMVMPDMLQAGYHIGLDTIGQTMRNANLQLRSDPIIPKRETGPWMQSTIEPDLARVPLEIGSTA